MKSSFSSLHVRCSDDVVKDPGETHDLGKQLPAKLKELKDAWEVYANEVGVVLSK